MSKDISNTSCIYWGVTQINMSYPPNVYAKLTNKVIYYTIVISERLAVLQLVQRRLHEGRQGPQVALGDGFHVYA